MYIQNKNKSMNKKLILGNCYLNNSKLFGTFDSCDLDPVTPNQKGSSATKGCVDQV